MSNRVITKGRTVIEEAARLLKEIRFSANNPAYIEGSHAAVSVDPRWRDDNSAIEAMITCFSLDAGPVDWDGLRINIDRKEGERSITWLTFLNARGQAVRRLPAQGDYSASLPYYARSEVFQQAIHPPIRARGSLELTHDAADQVWRKPFVREGDSPGGPFSWRMEETDQGDVRLSIRTTDEGMVGKPIVFSLVESGSGRMHSTGECTVSGIREPYYWVVLGSFAELSVTCDLVLESPESILE